MIAQDRHGSGSFMTSARGSARDAACQRPQRSRQGTARFRALEARRGSVGDNDHVSRSPGSWSVADFDRYDLAQRRCATRHRNISRWMSVSYVRVPANTGRDRTDPRAAPTFPLARGRFGAAMKQSNCCAAGSDTWRGRQRGMYKIRAGTASYPWNRCCNFVIHNSICSTSGLLLQARLR
jgi:hypothetical protein